MSAALHLAYAYEPPPGPRRKRDRGGPRGPRGPRAPYLIVPRNACEACAAHWHHKCWGVDLFLPDDQRPDCPCPCGDRNDPTGLRMSPAAWADLAMFCPEKVWQAVLMQQIRDGIAARFCAGPRHHNDAPSPTN